MAGKAFKQTTVRTSSQPRLSSTKRNSVQLRTETAAYVQAGSCYVWLFCVRKRRAPFDFRVELLTTTAAAVAVAVAAATAAAAAGANRLELIEAELENSASLFAGG